MILRREEMAVVPSTGLSRNPGEEPPEGGAANHALPSNPQSPIPNPEEWPEGRFANGRFPTAVWFSVLVRMGNRAKPFIHLLHPHWAAVWIQAILVAVLAACFYARSSESMLQFLLLHLATFFSPPWSATGNWPDPVRTRSTSPSCHSACRLAGAWAGFSMRLWRPWSSTM